MSVLTGLLDRAKRLTSRWRTDPRDELLALELFCLQQADLCILPESRAGLRELAGNYRAAADVLSADRNRSQAR